MSALVTREIERLVPYSAGMPLEQLARERGVTDAVKLASNENALGPSPQALQAAQAALLELHRYPDASAFALRRALAERLAVELTSLVFGNGSNELIELVIRTFTTQSHHVVFGEPSFVVYRSACLAHGVPFTAVPLRQGTYDLDGLLDALRSETRVVFIANPNNPTGTSVTRDALLRFLGAVGPDILVVLDEAYLEYAEGPEHPDGVELFRRHPQLIALRTFSKAYGLAGLRIGYAVCSPELASYLDRVRAPFNTSSVAQAAALAALGDEEHLARVIETNRAERARVAAELGRRGLDFYPSQANFLLVHFPADAAELNERFLQRGVIVRPIPGLPRSLRITLGTARENDRLLSTLDEVLK